MKDAAYHLRIASTLEQATEIFNDFRKEGYWKYKDTTSFFLQVPPHVHRRKTKVLFVNSQIPVAASTFTPQRTGRPGLV